MTEPVPLPDPSEFTLIADSAPVLMWVTRPDRKRSFVNRAYLDFLGLDEAAALEFDWRAVIHPDDHDRIVAESVAGEAGLGVFTLEGRYRRGDGQWRWLTSVSQPRRDADGRFIGFVGVAHDVTEAKLAQLALGEREQQLSALIEQTSAGLGQVDLHGRFTLVNDRFCAIVGRSRRELLGMTMQQITHPDDLPQNLSQFEAAAQDGKGYSHEKRYLRPDGSVVWVSNSVAVIRRANGEPYGVLAVTVDITARRAAEDRLRRNEESVRLAVESAGMATWELDLATLQGSWSPSWFALLGLPRTADGIGTLGAWLARVHPDDDARARGTVERCIADGTPFEIEFRIVRGDTGAERWLRSDGSRVAGVDGRPSRIVGIAFDVTDTRQAQEELRDNAQRLSFLDALGRAAVRATDADQVLAITTNMLGEHLRLSDCAYADMDADEDVFHIRGDWHVPALRSIVGTYRLADFGARARADLRAGDPFVVDDVGAQLDGDAARAFLALGIRATLWMPLIKAGRLAALMAIHDDAPRVWTAAELRLLREVAERSWAHIERVRTEAALRDSEQRLRLAVEGARIGTWDWDLKTARGTWSPRAAEIMGHDPATELTGDLRRRYTHPEHRDQLDAAIAGMRQTGELSEEYRIVRPDGTVRWVASRGVVLRDGAGYPVRATGTVRDVTDRRDAQEALTALNRTLGQQVAERTAERDRMWRLTRDLFVVVDPRRRIVAVNPAVGALGYAPAEVIGRRLTAFIHPDDRDAVSRVMRRVATAPIGDFSARLRASDGSWRYFSWSAVPGDGEAYVIGRDVTAEVGRREELELAQDALRQAQKVESLGQLTGGVAHDFNNLLTPIIGSLDLVLSRSGLGDRDARLLRAALDSAERARTLVQRLLAFARRQPLQPGPIAVEPLVANMAELIRSTAGPQVRVMVDIPAGLPPALADANQLELAILNLSVNARDAMPDGGTLILAAAVREIAAGDRARVTPGRYVSLSVTDTGVGMDEATMARAIEPFFSTKGIGKGTGLGLSMVHGLASQLGGVMLLTSGIGLGTRVELLLPVADDEPLPLAAPNARDSLPAAAGQVLLVDDEAAVRAATREMLQSLGFAVTEVGSAREALGMLRLRRPDYLVTDHLMPGMTGAQLAAAARDLYPDLNVLVISGYAELDGIPRALHRLAKPFRLDELAASLARAG